MSFLESARPSTASPVRSRTRGATALIGVALGVGLYLGGGAVAALSWIAPGTVLTLIGAAVLTLLWLLCLKLLPDSLVFAGIVSILLMTIIAFAGPGFPGRVWSPGGLLPATLLMGATSAFTATFSILSLGVPFVMAVGRRSSSTRS
ncbi:hypothetical protein [Microbacterium sp. ZW T5_56]|uniref:hypothetical protein n=1 Tax=Microbacterium sp. ZW T5_56 TaxID=3378081 RepID=UPI0038548D2D